MLIYNEGPPTEAERSLGMLRDDTELFHIAGAAAACFVAAGLYHWIGFLGVALFGMLIIFLAASVDLNDWRGAGMHQNLYQQRIVDDERYARNERAEWKGERNKRWRASDYAMMVGLAFLVVGGAGFLIFQLHA
jgi:hypothetical protein